jgi:hypothetical protein
MNKFLKEKESYFKESQDWEELFFRIYAFYVEPNLGKENLRLFMTIHHSFQLLLK